MGTLATRIKQRRIDLGLSMAQVAKACGVKAWQTVQQWENGETEPRRSRIAALSAVLQCSEESLLFPERDALNANGKYPSQLLPLANSRTGNRSANSAAEEPVGAFPADLIRRFSDLHPWKRAKVIERMEEYISYLEGKPAADPNAPQSKRRVHAGAPQ